MTRIVIEISGGCLGDIHSDDPDLEVSLLDHDDLEGGGTYEPMDWKGGDFDTEGYKDTMMDAIEKSKRNSGSDNRRSPSGKFCAGHFIN